MRHGAQRLVRLAQHVMRLGPVLARDKAHAAAAALIAGFVEANGSGCGQVLTARATFEDLLDGSALFRTI
ncbi:hypothetical protein GCM10008179_27180 [Hansschlegelia plantiphila]|uniref:Uncharacterized protein n=1 Tax=Hansschlegelia plantiphila TaxID=374655 RepID=A0A9W6J4I7_9HYPH|nr:hypothetical protein GCM10008179_27180 [Hansschlegelia plantiphila]